MSYNVIMLINREDAEFLNEGLDDDNKVAFQNKGGDEFFTYDDTDVSALDPNKYFTSTISQSVVDGSGLITKNRTIFPRP